MLRSYAFRLLPLRKLAKPKTMRKQEVEHHVRLVPHIPHELTKTTREFFQHKGRFKSLLDLVFSPTDPREDEEDRLDYERAFMEFEKLRKKARIIYHAHEQRADHRMWKAIHQLPEDLYEEAIRSRPEKVPEPLLFRERHKAEIFESLKQEKKRELQCAYNLMHVRYPYSEEKQRNPDRFWIPETQKITRQKEAAMQHMALKNRFG